MTLKCELVRVTPELAAQWLANNAGNRKLIPGNVERLVGTLNRGEWMEDSTDAIGLVMAADGETVEQVANGQHRLQAVIDSGAAVNMLVLYGVSREIIKVIDQGRARTLTQLLQIEGRYSNASVIAGGLTWLYRAQMGLEMHLGEGVKPTTIQLLDLFDQHQNLVNSVPLGMNVHDAVGVVGSGAATAYHYLCATVDAERADSFFAQLGVPEDDDEADMNPTVQALRSWYKTVRAHRDRKNREDGGEPPMVAALVKAWEAARADVVPTARQLKWSGSGARAEAFPRVSGLEADTPEAEQTAAVA
jgi:hypothetical protein